MKDQSSLNDVFRFVQLRQVDKVALLESTKIFSVIQQAVTARQRRLFANEIFRNPDTNDVVCDIAQLTYGTHLFESLQRALAEPEPDVAAFYRLIEDTTIVRSDSFRVDMERLSDTILLARFATEHIPDILPALRDLYLAYIVLERAVRNSAYLEMPLRRMLNAVISFPIFSSSANQSSGGIQSVGFADLLVVKQHILRYEATEIAHIENIMTGETRSREHRFLDRFEETLTFDVETTKEQEKELQTTERFEMNRETSRTIQEDQKYGAELSLSAYGPSIQFSSGFDMEISRSEESSEKTSSTYARDVMERSLERVQERIREERIRKVIRETEEKNLHAFQNAEGPHISGIYQFVDKIYKAQVFKYGCRQMFDLMIPEPASFLWHLEKNPSPTRPASVKAPLEFDIDPFDLNFDEPLPNQPLHKNHYTRFISRYGATGVTPPPPNKTVTFRHQQPGGSAAGGPEVTYASEGSASGDGFYLAPMRVLDIDIPEEYIPKSAVFHALANSDSGENVRIDFAFGQTHGYLAGNEMRHPDASSRIANMRFGLREISFDREPSTWNILEKNGKFHLSFFVYESANHAITGKVECEPSKTLIQKWQIDTYGKILAAYSTRMLEYQDEMSRVKAEQKALDAQQSRVIGIPPAKRKQVILNELKKHAISVFTDNHLFSPGWVRSNPMTEDSQNIPQFNTERARNTGDFIRFFEQAFEWDHVQYAFYPYFWHNDHAKWADRFLKDDSDYEYQQFLQAGAARVVLPVRPGFEEAIAYYQETGAIWNGSGSPPTIGDPMYVSIIQELRESTGGRAEEPIPVGKPWEVRLPTNLILLKNDNTLPAWREREEGNWDWVPDTGVTETPEA